MTSSDDLRNIINTLDPELELSREVLSDFADEIESGSLTINGMAAIFASTVVALETSLLRLEERLEDGGGIGSGGIQVSDPEDGARE